MLPYKLKLSPLQDVKIKKALQRNKGAILELSQTNEDENSTDIGIWYLSKKQSEKLEKTQFGQPIKFFFSAKQMEHQVHQGGFLSLLMAALAPIIGSTIGAAIDYGINSGKGITNDNIHVAKPNGSYSVKIHGDGLYLNPYPTNRRWGYGLFHGGKSIKTKDLPMEWNLKHRKMLNHLL